MVITDAILLGYAAMWVVAIVWMAIASYRSCKKKHSPGDSESPGE